MNTTLLSNYFNLDGKVALVTGASGGIGSAIARGLAIAGARVAIHGRSAEKLAKVAAAIGAAGGVCEQFTSDLGDHEAPAALVAAVAERCGGIDILVNCAGLNRRMPINEMTPEVYDLIMDANLRSAYFLSQAALSHMIAAGGGKVIHIGSLTSLIGLANTSVYGMTKSALAQLTKTMAVEWAQHNIQVNCICPGFIATDLTANLFADPVKSEWILSRIPSHQPGKPDDLAGMAIYLASPAANYTTGQVLFVDGGFTAGSPW
ncbi:MAG TPA: glucose 1-dehydrogenase [Roseiflexaceae bacterium]|nr:glucose 1-dehydrogenase [Roseiflexaceae bacterium]HMP41842.1 glucose 1-dehydrogenase [Roseiflexaceae bacterium]